MRLSRIFLALVLGATAFATVAEDAPRLDDPQRTEAAIRELVRRGAVVKHFDVRESETTGLLVRLKAEHLDRAGIVESDIVATLSQLPDLTVELRGVPFSDEGLTNLFAKTSLVGLDVSGSRISDRGLQSLAVARSRLRLLDLSFTRVGDAGLRSLVSQPDLRHLSLIGSRVTDAGRDSLEKLVALRELYLAETGVSANVAERLRKHLPKCRVER